MSLPEILSREYGLSVKTCELLSHGFVGRTYRVSAGKGEFCLKVSPLSQHTKNLSAALRLHAHLQSKLMFLPKVFSSLDGRYVVKFEGGAYCCTLFEFVVGETGFNYEISAFGKLLAELHSSSPIAEAKREDFQVPILGQLKDCLDVLFSGSPGDALVDKTRLLLRPLQAELTRDLETLAQRSLALQSGSRAMVPTHGDAPGNILRAADGYLYLLDTDDLILAPSERDLWFQVCPGASARHAFLEAYGAAAGSLVIDEILVQFYALSRHANDLFDDLELILDETAAPGSRTWALENITSDVLGWSRTAVRGLDFSSF